MRNKRNPEIKIENDNTEQELISFSVLVSQLSEWLSESPPEVSSEADTHHFPRTVLKDLHGIQLHLESNNIHRNSYDDATDLFLSVQAVFLRFRDDATVTRKALSVVETLARVCVGPAWHRQLRLRSSRQNSRLAKDVFDPPSRHSTPSYSANAPQDGSADCVFTSTEAHGNHHDPCAIPELLPAAMIRYAAFYCQEDLQESGTSASSQSFEKKELIRLQISLVQSLTCEDCETEGGLASIHDKSSRKWLIVGVQDEMTILVHSWMAFATKPSASALSNTTKTLLDSNQLVIQACRQLLTNGWCPRGEMIRHSLAQFCVQLLDLHAEDPGDGDLHEPS